MKCYKSAGPPRPGLRENTGQFALLVGVNALVGGMLGIERSIFPQFAEEEFGIVSQTAILSFIAAFGLSKALANYYAGRLAERFGRRRLLLAGWAAALPVPWMLMAAPSWAWVGAVNVLLGVSQGLAWSSTVVMKIDLAGEKRRGFALGINEFAGYLALGLSAFLSGYASRYGIRPYPFYLGAGISLAGFFLSWGFVKDTSAFVRQEARQASAPPLKRLFFETSFRSSTLGSVTQAGLVNNLNDGMIWGLLPAWLLAQGMAPASLSFIAAIYPAVWGVGQLFTGTLADRASRKALLFWGMAIQGLAILLIPAAGGFWLLAGLSAALGIGTALVYPTFLAVIADGVSPGQRAESIGIFRLWRDMGYVAGALFSGLAADLLGMAWAIGLTGLLTLASALIIRWRMPAQTHAQTLAQMPS